MLTSTSDVKFPDNLKQSPVVERNNGWQIWCGTGRVRDQGDCQWARVTCNSTDLVRFAFSDDPESRKWTASTVKQGKFPLSSSAKQVAECLKPI